MSERLSINGVIAIAKDQAERSQEFFGPVRIVVDEAQNRIATVTVTVGMYDDPFKIVAQIDHLLDDCSEQKVRETVRRACIAWQTLNSDGSAE